MYANIHTYVYDRYINKYIFCVDAGKVVEYDSARRLLEDSCSSFSKLVAECLRRSSKSNPKTEQRPPLPANNWQIRKKILTCPLGF